MGDDRVLRQQGRLQPHREQSEYFCFLLKMFVFSFCTKRLAMLDCLELKRLFVLKYFLQLYKLFFKKIKFRPGQLC